MNDRILNLAQAWGFICNFDVQGKCQILPQQVAERWKLQLVGERWLLVVNDVPQILCHLSEAIAFLERQRPTAKTLTLRSLLLN
jgi:hypothetical protein